MRSTMPSWRIERTDGNHHLAVAPLPHAERAPRTISCARPICFVDGVYFSPNYGK